MREVLIEGATYDFLFGAITRHPHALSKNSEMVSGIKYNEHVFIDLHMR